MLKGLERAIELDRMPLPPKLTHSFKVIASRVPPDATRDLVLRAVCDGDPTAQLELASLGIWALTQAARYGDGGGGESWIQQFVEIEYASKRADSLLSAGDFAGAADALAADATLRCYLTDLALARLAGASDLVDALPCRIAGICEMLLSNVARVDIESRQQRASDDSFAWLLTGKLNEPAMPGRQLTKRTVKHLGPGTLEGLLSRASTLPDRDEVNLSTLKRWNCGRDFPSRRKFGNLVKPILSLHSSRQSDGPDLVRYGYDYWAARRLHKTLELVRKCAALPLTGERPTGLLSLLGGNSPESWARARYVHWLEIWTETRRQGSATWAGAAPHTACVRVT